MVKRGIILWGLSSRLKKRPFYGRFFALNRCRHRQVAYAAPRRSAAAFCLHSLEWNYVLLDTLLPLRQLRI
jgi:hypothetical protein